MEQKKSFVRQRIKAYLTVLALLAIVVLPAQGLAVERPSAKEIPDAVREAVDKAVASVRPAKIYIQAAPDAPNARAAEDEIIKWELLMERGE